jgi:ATP-dependent DNA helicase RecQ
MHPLELLERYWKHHSFRPYQEEIIEAVMSNEDVFALLPTGAGKSVCYQLPAIALEGICIVVSPLIALMQDQVKDLKSKGIKSIALHSGLSKKEIDIALDNARFGKYKLLYLSPERLEQPLVQSRIQQMKVSFIAVDEAHCISQWGYDFRPAYLHIRKLREWHPHANCIALTATAKKEIISDITKSLDFINPKIIQGSFKRNNIALNVTATDDKWYYLTQALDRSLNSSIVYVRTRNATIEISRKLNEAGYSSAYFHGGLSSEEKTNKLHEWLQNRVATMVATTAFGMGINKENVDTVVHYHLTESLESYYQEVGRAGRNGLPATGLLLYKPADEQRLKKQFIEHLPENKDLKYIYNKLCNYFQVAYGEMPENSFQFDFKKFCSTYKLQGKLSYNCLQILDRSSIINLHQQFNFRTRIQFVVSNQQLFQYLERNPNLELPVKTLLRTYGGIFDFETKVNLDLIVKKTQLTEKKLISLLHQLESDEIIHLQLASSDSEISFLKPREDDLTINPILPVVRQQITQKKKQIESVIDYIKNDRVCRQMQLLTYFGEHINEPCGICSVCIQKSKKTEKPLESIEESILSLLHNNSLSSRELHESLNCNEDSLVEAIKRLLEGNKIEITTNNQYKCRDPKPRR